MLEVPHLDNIWSGHKEHHNNVRIIWFIESRISSIPKIACFYKPHGSLTMLGSPKGSLVGSSLRQQTMIHVKLSSICDWSVFNRQNMHITSEHI